MHGTIKGYRLHREAGNPACERCLRATARYEQQRQLDILAGRDRLVDKMPYVRRLQALMAMGWPARELSRRLGRGDTYVKTFIARPEQPTVRRPIAEEIDKLYESLAMTPGPSERSRQLARQKRWPTPLAWDDIDAGVLATTEGGEGFFERFDEDLIDYAMQYHDFDLRLNPTEKKEIMRRWIADGRSEASLCRLTGWRPGRYAPKREAS